MTKIKMVCVVCGSDDVCVDASARWDVDAQEWVLSGVLDGSTCEDCEDSDARLEEVPL